MKTIERKISLKEILGDGMQVRLLCQVGLYRDRGMISLNVLDVDPSFTKGALALAREQLLKELSQHGLDKKNKQCSLNPFPFRIGLISADQSRAKSDFLNQLESYHYSGVVIFQDARMQGERIVAEVISAFRGMIEAGVDAIVLTRGGGSAADLRWFDHRDIALTIAHCPIPVIAAIGHHDDVCVAEMICYQREKTPTAAADFVLSRILQTRERISMLAEGASKLANNRLNAETKLLQRCKDHLSLAAISSLERKKEGLFRSFSRLKDTSQARLQAEHQKTERLGQMLNLAATKTLSNTEHILMKLEAMIQSKDPKPWLERGWTQLFDDSKQLIRSTKALTVGARLHARLIDGSFDARVERVTEDKDRG
jgi:exodeoxyribonuclease VII large subunit